VHDLRLGAAGRLTHVTTTLTRRDPNVAGNDKLERVRKLLAMAEAEELTPEARDAYNAKAAHLIAEYGIDVALLGEAAPDGGRAADVVIRVDPPYALEKTGLLWSVLTPLRCEGVRRRRFDERGTRAYSMHAFGMRADLERAELLYTSLLVQVAFGLATARPEDPLESVAAFRRTWFAGFTAAIAKRLEQAENHARERAERDRGAAGAAVTGRSVALVLADRSALVERARDEAYPTLRAARPRMLSGSGFRPGQLAGQRADLGGRRVGASGRRALERGGDG
jgi:Protein of unknown function (DUF2786)